VVSPPPGSGIHCQNSLRAKLSLPNLRRNRSKPDDETGSGAYERDLRERHRHGEQAKEAELDLETEMLHVQGMAFELVRPNFTQIQAARTSEDAGVLRRDGSFDLLPDGSGNAGSLLRPESPAVSVSTTMKERDRLPMRAQHRVDGLLKHTLQHLPVYPYLRETQSRRRQWKPTDNANKNGCLSCCRLLLHFHRSRRK